MGRCLLCWIISVISVHRYSRSLAAMCTSALRSVSTLQLLSLQTVKYLSTDTCFLTLLAVFSQSAKASYPFHLTCSECPWQVDYSMCCPLNLHFQIYLLLSFLLLFYLLFPLPMPELTCENREVKKAAYNTPCVNVFAYLCAVFLSDALRQRISSLQRRSYPQCKPLIETITKNIFRNAIEVAVIHYLDFIWFHFHL